MHWRKRLLLTQLIPISQIILDYYLLCESIEATILTGLWEKAYNIISLQLILLPFRP
jgi:uncharacterized protein (UPF0262 family)